MSPNTEFSALLTWLPWLLVFLPPHRSGSAPISGAPEANGTLLFHTGAPGFSLRNCSCMAPVQDCDKDSANALCECHSVSRSALPPAGLRETAHLSVWIHEPWVLKELLNTSFISRLHLSFCGTEPVDSQYLVLIGLRFLRVHSAAPQALYPDQQISFSPAAGATAGLSTDESITFLDVAVLNGRSALKAYSVLPPLTRTLSQTFPHLDFGFAEASDGPDGPQAPSGTSARPQRLLTIVY